MRILICALLVAVSASSLPAQAITRDSITTGWAKRHLIGGIDTGPRIGNAWSCIRSWPEVTTALIDVFKESGSNTLIADDALLMLGATGQDSAYKFLIARLDEATTDPGRTTIIIALGNSAEAPDYVFDRLERMLTADQRADFSTALRAVSDIRTPAAFALLRKIEAATRDTVRRSMIGGTLARMVKQPRVASTCDSTLIGHDPE